MDTLSYKTKSANAKTVEKQWFIVDAEDQPLGRISSEIAKILRGKHKAYFTPHVDCGDNVVVINAEKVKIPFNKLNQKKYITHSGFPGGQKSILAKDLLIKRPTAVLENAVRGMLPKNRLGRKVFHNMFAYEGTEHEQGAQKPTVLKFKL